MRHYYALFLTGLGLLTNLTACSPDTKSETRASRKSPPAALSGTAITTPNAGSIGRVNPDVNQQPAAKTGQWRNTVLAPAGKVLPEVVPAIPPTARRQLAWLARRQRRAATAATSTLPAEMARPAAGPAFIPAPAAASAADSAPAPADGTKTAQVFRIRPDRDTVLYGTEGTVMRIPAGTFVQGTNRKGTAPQGPVEIRLREFYSMADILLERLSTLAGPRLLETGGMVQLSATAADGRECKLRPGSEFELGFPATRPIEGMQLYNGQNTGEHGLNWKLAPQAKTKSRKRWNPTQHWLPPGLTGIGGRQRLRKAIEYTPAMAMERNGYQPPRQLRRQLRRTNKRAAVVGLVQASFELSEKGRVNDVYFRSAGPADSALRATVAQGLRRLVVEPSYIGRSPSYKATRSLMKVDVRFTADRRVLVDHLRWDRASTVALYKADAERKATGKGRLSDAQVQAAPLDVVTDELFKKRQTNAKRYSVGSLLGEQLNYVKELAVFRVKVVAAPQSLGWANCDRPMPPLLARITMGSNIRAPKGGLAKLALVRLGLEHPATQPADISLVLRDRRCVIRGDAREGRVTFEQLADSTAATLIAIRREQGQLYLGLRDVLVRQRVEPPLEFRPVTVAELRAAVARLDL
ncbi:MAG: energy transducer TonB [Hymenobacter sp.]|nr:energy transducer TonB [Hymenobacter sp.]